MTSAAEVVQGLIARGVPPHVAYGIAGNISVESGFDAGINEIAPLVPGSRGGFGLYQVTGPRRRQYEAFAGQRGAQLDDTDAQLDFLMHEGATTEKRAFDAVMNAQTTEEAARLFSERFLRPGIPHLDRRIAEAQRIAGMPLDAAKLQARNHLVAEGGDQRQANYRNALADTRQDVRNFLTETQALPPTLRVDQFMV